MTENIFFLSFIGALCSADIIAFGQFMICRPIFCAPLIGFLMGDINTGIFIGIISELFWLKVFPMGVSVVVDVSMVGILATFWTCKYFPGTKAAEIFGLLISIPFAYFYRLIDLLGRKFNLKIMHWVESGIQETKNWRIEIGIWLGLLLFVLRAFVFYLFAMIIGGQIFSDIYLGLPKHAISGLEKAWYLLPIAGFGSLYNLNNVRMLFLGNSRND